jgi:hypothetical protein
MKLQLAFSQCQNNVVNLLMKLYRGGVQLPGGDLYTPDEFAEEWPLGGKKYLERFWRDPANKPTGHFYSGEDAEDDTVRELWQGKHEWIPTDMLGYIIENGCLIHHDIKWVYLAEVLRTPTRYVVVKPSKLNRPEGANPMGFVGHVGALYVSKGSERQALFKGQSTFHDVLREIIKDSLSPAKNAIDTYCRELKRHITDWYWQGDLFSASTFYGGTNPQDFSRLRCPYLYLSGTSQYTSWGDDMGQMARTLAQGWTLWNQVMANQVTAMNFL